MENNSKPDWTTATNSAKISENSTMASERASKTADGFNSQSLVQMCATFCKCFGVTPPQFASDPIDELCDYVLAQTKSGKIDKVVIFNPDAIAEWCYYKYKNLLPNLEKFAPYVQPLCSVFPPKTPVCFATMYSGATPAQHGITKYTKPCLTIDTIFDALIRAGKKPCIVTVAEQSMDKLFRNRKMDYFAMENDQAVVAKAIALIGQDKYDFICVYNQEYDDIMHRTHPNSFLSKRALVHYNASFGAIAQAVATFWKKYDTMLGCATDHGTHREWYLLGQHGKNIPADMNICHFYGVIPAKK
ncbi:MAG: alkaline phosphatase family protein [Clostridia bacterium]